jgi:2-phospho-L-lactate guanylyltransferase
MTDGSVLAGVPVKSFEAAKQRLAAGLAREARIGLSQEMARNTCRLLERADVELLILAGDERVAEWGDQFGWEVLLDQGSDLNLAATSVVERADGPWLICHADLPFLDGEVLTRLLAGLSAQGSVIPPSRDGGTSALGSSLDSFRFAYGPGSFRRHLGLLLDPPSRVLVDPRLAIDLDDPSDLEVARARIPWIAKLLDTLDQS